MVKTRKIHLFCALVFMMIAMFASASLAQSKGFTVSGTIIVHQAGEIMLGLMSETNAKNGKPSLGARIKVGPDDVRRGEVRFIFEDVPEGVYAIQCYLDTNGNGKMDFGLFGIPLEPWGNYRDVRPKLRGPKFNEIAFTVDRDITDISFRLKK